MELNSLLASIHYLTLQMQIEFLIFALLSFHEH